MSNIVQVTPDLGFVERVMQRGGSNLKRCFQCATCCSVCTLTPDKAPFPRKEMMWAQWGMRGHLVGDPDIWLCHHCGDCSAHCPRGAKPGEALQAMRSAVVSELSFPRFFADALNEPKIFPALLLLPMLWLGVVMWEAGTLAIHPGEIIYAKLMPHSVFFEGMFMVIAGWSVLVGAVGVWRQWEHMKRVCPAPAEGPARSIASSIAQALGELVLHTRFQACGQNRARTLAHILVIVGFFSAMAAAGGGAVLEKVFQVNPPIPVTHPVKWFGILGALGLLTGCAMLISRRLNEEETVGDSSFYDWAFLGVLFAVGLTGTLSYVFRLMDVAVLAYPTYFVHLSLVVFLLGTVAYTKFAHVFYRTAAMTYAIHVGRTVPAARQALPAPVVRAALPAGSSQSAAS